MPVRATAEDFRDAFDGLVFPASQPAVLRHVQDHGGIDTEVMEAVAELPDETFEDMGGLLAAIREVYRAHGTPAEAIPV